MTYRDDLEALQSRARALETDVKASAQQLDEARRLLDEARRRGRLPVLDNVHVAAPCKASWDDMVGDDRSRFCGQCDKNVYNLSAMSRPEAEALLIEKEGRLCVRYYQRTDGTVLTADCPDGLRRRRRKKRVVAAAFGAMSAVAAAGSLLHRGARMGDVAPRVGQAAIVTNAPPAQVPIMGEPAPVEPPIMGKPMVLGRMRPFIGSVEPAPQAAKTHHKKR